MVMMKSSRRRSGRRCRPQAVSQTGAGARGGVRFRRFASPAIAHCEAGPAVHVTPGVSGVYTSPNSACASFVQPTLASTARFHFPIAVRSLLPRRRRGLGSRGGWLHYNGSLILTSTACTGSGVNPSLHHPPPKLAHALPCASAPVRPFVLRGITAWGRCLMNTTLSVRPASAHHSAGPPLPRAIRGRTCPTTRTTGGMG